MGWSRPAQPEQGDRGFDTYILAKLMTASTWANGALNEPFPGHEAVPLAAHAAPPVKLGERVKGCDPSPYACQGWCVVSLIEGGSGYLVTETPPSNLGAGWRALEDLRDPAKYERGGMASAGRRPEREEVPAPSEPPIEHGVPLADLPDEARPHASPFVGTGLPRRMTEREVQHEREVCAERTRAKKIHDAAWFGVFQAAIAGCATICPVDEAAAKRHGPEAQFQRAVRLADLALAEVRGRGIVPPAAGDDIEALSAVLQESEPAAAPIINITNTFSADVDSEKIMATFTRDIEKAVKRGAGGLPFGG